MTNTSSAPIVVGVDGSAEAMRATRLGAIEASLRARPLHLLHVVDWPINPGWFITPELEDQWEKQLIQAGEELLQDAQANAAKVAPDLSISTDVRVGGPSHIMLDETSNAVLLVVGARGTGGFEHLLAGSVATQVSAHAGCPVLIARPQTSMGANIVAGVKGTTSDAAVLDFAFAEASMRGVGVTAIHVWRGPLTDSPKDMLPPVIYDTDDVAEEESRVLVEALSGYAERYPDVPIKELTLRGRPAHVLVKHTASAGLVVVGPWGWRGVAGRLLGSVSQAVLHNAQCPVAIVRS